MKGGQGPLDPSGPDRPGRSPGTAQDADSDDDRRREARPMPFSDVLAAIACVALLLSAVDPWMYPRGLYSCGPMVANSCPSASGAFAGVGIVMVPALLATVVLIALGSRFFRKRFSLRLPGWVERGGGYLVIAAVELGCLALYFLEFHHPFQAPTRSPTAGFVWAMVGALLTGVAGLVAALHNRSALHIRRTFLALLACCALAGVVVLSAASGAIGSPWCSAAAAQSVPVATPRPTPGFRPLTASDAQLIANGYPPRPPGHDAIALAAWRTAVKDAKHWVPPPKYSCTVRLFVPADNWVWNGIGLVKGFAAPAPAVRVPALLGKPELVAERLLRSMGLRYQIVQLTHGPILTSPAAGSTLAQVPGPRVLAQVPGPGVLVPGGSIITLNVYG